MSELAMSPHPRPELLAAFVEGRLEQQEIAEVSRHLARCSDCREVVAEAAWFGDEERAFSDPPRHLHRHFRIRRWWTGLAAAAAIAAVAVAIAWKAEVGDDPVQRLQGSHRSIQARLTILDYAPLKITRAAGEDSDWEVLSAAGELQERASRNRTVTNLHRAAVGHLVLGRVDSAVTALSELASQEPANLAVLTDLSAALIASGRDEEAASLAARVLAKDPQFAPAAFNRAIALENMNSPAASGAWLAYLRLDRDSPWAGEAREHVKRLREP